MKATRIFLASVITLTLSSFCALAQMQRPPMPKGEGPHREHETCHVGGAHLRDPQ